MQEKVAFTKEYDATILAFSILKRLGCGGVGSFDERLKSQKVQYLAQLFGVSPAYTFSLYIRGPYSSALANDLFKIRDAKISASEEKFVPEELEERFMALKKFIEKKTLRELELITTLHLLLKSGKYTEGGSIKELQELKSASPYEAKTALEAVKHIPQ